MNKEVFQTIGNRLRFLRKKHNKTFREITEITGGSIAYLCDIEHGNSIPSLHTCQKLAQVYHIELSEMFEDVFIVEVKQ